MKRGEPLRRLTPMPRPRERMRAKKKRRSARDRDLAAAERRARLIVRERSGGVCEACGMARATDWAHRVAEGQGGPWCPSNGLHLCHPDHMWCHANPQEARARGWMLHSGDDPQMTPARLTYGWALLHADGTVDIVPAPP